MKSNISVELKDHQGSDLTVVNAARVSFDKESDFLWNGAGEIHGLKEADSRLLTFLAKHKHKSPFNHCFMSFRVKAPIFVARQLVKHEYLPWNEVSRRYVKEDPEYMTLRWRWATDNKKQGSGGEVDDYTQYMMDQVFWRAIHSADNAYKELLAMGACEEQARAVLPLDMMTSWWWSGSLFAFAKMCKLRLDPHAQLESQEVAKLISAEAENLFPVSWKALMEYAE